MELTPKQVVRELDRYIIGQDEAKRAVAVALRNRYRRAQLPEEIRDEIVPKNILMVGPTGVGKTEIARRLAKLVDAPFVKVEATKFTEVGYVGRDVESIIRDLVEASVRICKEKASQKVKARATVLAEERIIDLILHPNRKPVNPIDVLLGNKPKQPELPAEEKQRIAQKADELRAQLQRGELEDVEIEVEVEDAPKDVEINGASVNIGSMMGDMMPKKTKMRRMKVADARRLLVAEEEDKLIDMDAVTEEALHRAEQDGIIFIDEIDKVAGRQRPGCEPRGRSARHPADRRGQHGEHQIRRGQDGLHALYRGGRVPCGEGDGSHSRIAGTFPGAREFEAADPRGFQGDSEPDG